MPKYLIFAGTPPNDGGMNDYYAPFDSYEDIEPYLIKALRLHEQKWWHVVDVESCKIILTSNEFYDKYIITKCQSCGKTIKITPKHEHDEFDFQVPELLCSICERETNVTSPSSWCDLEGKFCGYLAGVTKEKCDGCEELPNE